MKKTMKTKKDFSCGGLVWDEENKKILIVEVENLSGARVWTFPKGHPEGKETDEAAALREVREETGWLCEIIRPMTDIRYFYVHKNVRFNKTVRWFLMKPVEKTGQFDPDEILSCLWAGLEDVKKRIVYETDKKLVKELEKFC